MACVGSVGGGWGGGGFGIFSVSFWAKSRPASFLKIGSLQPTEPFGLVLFEKLSKVK